MSASGPPGPLAFMSAAFILEHFRMDFYMRANKMNPDLTNKQMR